MTERQNALEIWLRTVCGQQFDHLQAMQGDASFRRYFRLQAANNTYVVMDAKPPKEDCRPYIAIAKCLRNMGLQVPEIFYSEEEQGFLLISDFGDLTYLKALTTRNADQLYTAALDVLMILQTCRHVQDMQIPSFTREIMWQEWAWCKEWFLAKLLDLSLSQEKHLDNCYALLVESAASQPQVFMHRDYHSANLMVLPKNQVGVLDFQDAFMGPVTYDLVSLLRDCYIDWPEECVEFWALSYWKRLNEEKVIQGIDQEIFLKWFDWMGIERHLKALFTFSRKYVRDEQSAYLKHIPRTMQYLLDATERYEELAPLHDYFSHTVEPALQQVRLLCVQ
ncbi:MAG: hypothetical protein A3F11_09355 [Gammaproteobacteria bacterium RIFCSPHIGHO2_12_FULL_37_14]|nr:MAG: hypothetical protein A3F11_09355 [Gammaproteobacteria bacterium RIFCSPHIGHO2_12_FULL_37_14]